mgnify:CR=1 FL=1
MGLVSMWRRTRGGQLGGGGGGGAAGWRGDSWNDGCVWQSHTVDVSRAGCVELAAYGHGKEETLVLLSHCVVRSHLRGLERARHHAACDS